MNRPTPNPVPSRSPLGLPLQRYEDEQRALGKVDTSIVLRADRNSDYSQVFELLQVCKVVGYKKLRLRALTRGGAS